MNKSTTARDTAGSVVPRFESEWSGSHCTVAVMVIRPYADWQKLPPARGAAAARPFRLTRVTTEPAENDGPPQWFTRALAQRPERRNILVDGGAVHYRLWGPRGAPGVVLIHGG